MSASVSPTKLIAAAALALVLSACGSDDVPGTITEDDLPGSVEVEKVTHDVQAGQVTCSDVNDAEDNHVLTQSENSDSDRRAAVSYQLSGDETVSNSVWRLTDPKAAVEQVAAGLEKCVADHPDAYQRFEVEGQPDALGYVAQEGDPAIYTRRILVPVDDRVVIVTSTKDGDDDFAVPPEDVLEKALEASGDAPQA